MEMAIVKQYIKNAFRVIAVLFIAVALLWIGDKTQVVTYGQLAADYLNNVEVKKTVVRSAASSGKKVVASSARNEQAPKKDVLWDHVGRIKGEYVAQKGDTLWSIARKHNVPPQKLLLANNMTRDTKLRPNQLITIPQN